MSIKFEKSAKHHLREAKAWASKLDIPDAGPESGLAKALADYAAKAEQAATVFRAIANVAADETVGRQVAQLRESLTLIIVSVGNIVRQYNHANGFPRPISGEAKIAFGVEDVAKVVTEVAKRLMAPDAARLRTVTKANLVEPVDGR